MDRLRCTSVSGFPLRGSATADLAPRPTPPSSNRTCGFPASGSPGSTPRRYAHEGSHPRLDLLASRVHYQQLQVRRGACAQAVLLALQLRQTSSDAPSLPRHYPASSLLWAPPTPGLGRNGVMNFPVPLWADPTPAGSPRFLGCSFGTRHPLSPRRAERLHTLVSSPSTLGFILFGRLAALTLLRLTRPHRVRLSLWLMPSSHEASP